MIIIWEMPDKSLAFTQILGGRDAGKEVQKILAERPELTHRLTTNDTSIHEYTGDIFFKALEMDETFAFKYNMEKAREIWRNKIRVDRIPVMSALDVQYQRAQEQGKTDLMAEVVSKKNILRDAPNNPLIDSATTITELKEVYPDLLK